MDLYILDSLLRRSEMVESYESLVWTERYSAEGDFVLEMDPHLAERDLFKQGTMLACNKSDRVMILETNELLAQEDGTKKIRCTGRSLEHILSERHNDYVKLGTNPLGNLSLVLGDGVKTPATIIRDLFASICVTNPTVADRIPFIQAGTYYNTVGAIAEPTATPSIQTEIGSLYDTIKSVADLYRIGFRLVRPLDDSKLYFEVYTGFNRTTTQTNFGAVVFSSELDNLTNTSELTSIAGLKNIAHVYAVSGSAIVYGEGASASTSGFDRKVLVVKAEDITQAPGAILDAMLQQRGQEELAKARSIIGFDGQIAQNSSLVYGIHYMLGDLVEQRSESGTRNIMKVTEQIFTSDASGEKAYPTLTVDSVIGAGTWDAALASQTWDGYTTETWDTQ